jgi:hypothetical protein
MILIDASGFPPKIICYYAYVVHWMCYDAVLVNSNLNSMLFFWYGRWCIFLTWCALMFLNSRGHFFRTEEYIPSCIAIHLCWVCSTIQLELMLVGVGPGLNQTQSHGELMAVGGWARLLAGNQTRNGLSQANVSQLNQTTDLCHTSQAVADLGLACWPGLQEPRNQTHPRCFTMWRECKVAIAG